MERYLVEGRMTAQGLAGLVKQPADRAEVLRPLFEAGGGRLVAFYFSPQELTSTSIVELPDGSALDPIIIAVAAAGSVDVATVRVRRVLTGDELVDVFTRAGDVTWAPPT